MGNRQIERRPTCKGACHTWAAQEMCGGATIIGNYRYTLWREWNPELSRLLFVLLNPSIADASVDDPTLRRCIGFARDRGYGSVELVNLYGLRGTDPRALRHVVDPVGPLNDQHIQQAAGRAEKIVVAWGALGDLHGRDQAVECLLPQTLWCLGYTRSGAPRHPLYVRRDAALLPYPVHRQREEKGNV